MLSGREPTAVCEQAEPSLLVKLVKLVKRVILATRRNPPSWSGVVQYSQHGPQNRVNAASIARVLYVWLCLATWLTHRVDPRFGSPLAVHDLLTYLLTSLLTCVLTVSTRGSAFLLPCTPHGVAHAGIWLGTSGSYIEGACLHADMLTCLHALLPCLHAHSSDLRAYMPNLRHLDRTSTRTTS